MGWMDWNRGVERDRQVLQGILVFLVSFAGMAERLPSLSAPVRRELLGILRRGEASARRFVFAEVHNCGVALPRQAYVALAASLAEAGDEAERLAQSFRALALVVAAMLAKAQRFSRVASSDAAGVRSIGRFCGSQSASGAPGKPAHWREQVIPALQAPDTS